MKLDQPEYPHNHSLYLDNSALPTDRCQGMSLWRINYLPFPFSELSLPDISRNLKSANMYLLLFCPKPHPLQQNTDPNSLWPKSLAQLPRGGAQMQVKARGSALLQRELNFPLDRAGEVPLQGSWTPHHFYCPWWSTSLHTHSPSSQKTSTCKRSKQGLPGASGRP